MAVSGATLRKSMKTFKAGNRKFASGVSKLTKGVEAVNAGKAPVFKGDVKGAAKFYPKRDVAAVRAEVTRPKRKTQFSTEDVREHLGKLPSTTEARKSIRKSMNANARRNPDWSPRPYQTSNWSKQKSSTEIGNYLAWKYSGFKKGGY